MLHTSPGYILVRSFPECAVVLLVGCYLLKIKVPKNIIFKKTLILGLMVSLIRTLPINFGIHTILSMTCTLFMLANLTKDSFINCIIAICKIFISLILSEFVYIFLVTFVFKIPESNLVDNYTVSSAIFTLPSLLILVLISVLIQFVTDKVKEKFLIED
ncbi:MAG: hypothetical protein RSG52_01600 [Terrisporobacter sp.]|uniref:hypothetical protein n=1 Tax=Terrisporobacter sp. TaxID=1965305 RepID=UPI002FC85EC5